MKPKATIKDVASLAGVSFKTVSRVINNEGSVADAMKEKVWKAIKTLDYKPNLSARGLRGAASAIGFIYDNPNSNYVIDMQSGILRECREQGYELIIHPCNADADDLVTEVMDMIHRSRVGGLVLTPPLSENTEILEQLAAKHVRFVRIVSGSNAPDHLSPCVYIDDRNAARNITEHLLELGHRDIAFLGGDEEHGSSGERLAGYRDALAAKGIAAPESMFVPGTYSFESGVQRTRELLSRAQRPTAIFACNDEIAAGTLFAARIAGVDVPDQLSIAGFEDSPFSRQAWPNLTTAQQPTQVIAQRATRLLINSLRSTKYGQVIESEGFLPELLKRQSTGPVAK
ncbi:transcriptional regulator, LacI family [Teredinibacter turnerae T7901]|uniref:Transcriptional regulator, LacI family n=1 Tax=Teredinibacter turnerae (strain ATCC 39867 / T7901) TaxID=377629 RepID=C5BPK0_TERTT|nr:LacI family DNA-binding transcriptional regulator [Teredinibacter turnerae]ACR11796.1 transcriptional regulator, LacI family [Teredinibacter turnerae T7901]